MHEKVIKHDEMGKKSGEETQKRPLVSSQRRRVLLRDRRMVFNAFDFLIGFVSFTGDKDDIAGRAMAAAARMASRRSVMWRVLARCSSSSPANMS